MLLRYVCVQNGPPPQQGPGQSGTSCRPRQVGYRVLLHWCAAFSDEAVAVYAISCADWRTSSE